MTGVEAVLIAVAIQGGWSMIVKPAFESLVQTLKDYLTPLDPTGELRRTIDKYHTLLREEENVVYPATVRAFLQCAEGSFNALNQLFSKSHPKKEDVNALVKALQDNFTDFETRRKENPGIFVIKSPPARAWWFQMFGHDQKVEAIRFRDTMICLLTRKKLRSLQYEGRSLLRWVEAKICEQDQKAGEEKFVTAASFGAAISSLEPKAPILNIFDTLLRFPLLPDGGASISKDDSSEVFKWMPNPHWTPDYSQPRKFSLQNTICRTLGDVEWESGFKFWQVKITHIPMVLGIGIFPADGTESKGINLLPSSTTCGANESLFKIYFDCKSNSYRTSSLNNKEEQLYGIPPPFDWNGVIQVYLDLDARNMEFFYDWSSASNRIPIPFDYKGKVRPAIWCGCKGDQKTEVCVEQSRMPAPPPTDPDYVGRLLGDKGDKNYGKALRDKKINDADGVLRLTAGEWEAMKISGPAKQVIRESAEYLSNSPFQPQLQVPAEDEKETKSRSGPPLTAPDLYEMAKSLYNRNLWHQAFTLFSEYRLLILRGNATGIPPEKDNHLAYMWICRQNGVIAGKWDDEDEEQVLVGVRPSSVPQDIYLDSLIAWLKRYPRLEPQFLSLCGLDEQLKYQLTEHSREIPRRRPPEEEQDGGTGTI